REEVLINYLGFPFWDVLTFPVMTWREVGEFNELLVDRISVHDARALKTIECAQKLKGIFFEHTAAFLSRAYRENDYLLGRLHALDRLLDIVCDSAGRDLLTESELLALKKRGFMQILDAEAPHLPNSGELIAELRAGVAALTADADTAPAPRYLVPATFRRMSEQVAGFAQAGSLFVCREPAKIGHNPAL